ncbi:AT-hook motif nuclear-localized protein 3-like [Nicotiana tomentosiformis]
MPISASIPLTGDFSPWKNNGSRPVDSLKKKNKFEVETPGERMEYFVGANLTAHVIIVNVGEDVSMKIISFAQQESRAICVLAANGAISNVTLHQTNSSGGTLTYEGRFDILSLRGSFMPSDDGVTTSRSGGLSVSLSDPDGQVIGGGLAGLLVAASLVQVIVGSFPAGHQLEQNREKQWIEHAAAFAAIPAPPISEERANGAYSGLSPHVAASISFPGNNSMSGMPGEESNQQSPSS